MSVTSAARNRGAVHAQAGVPGFHNILFGDRRPEAGPASAGFELRGRAVKGGVAANAAEHALVVNVEKVSGERSLRPRLAGHLEGFRGQLLPPLRVSFLNRGNCDRPFSLAVVRKFDDGDLPGHRRGRRLGVSRLRALVAPQCKASQRGC